MDQRDLLLDQLNQIVHVTSEQQPDGTVTVLIGGTDLVMGPEVRAVTTRSDAAGNRIPTWSTGGDLQMASGTLPAYIHLRDAEMVGYQARLDQLAQGVADAVNALHATGVDATGAAGLPFFTYTAAQGVAATLAVNAAIVADPRRVAAAAVSAGSPPAAPAPGDATVAGLIADLRNGRILGGGTQTVSDFYAAIVGTVGSDSRQAQEMAVNEGLVVDSLKQRRESTSGVSLDEEATDMIRFQHAYQAATRVITSMDEMLDTLINRTGIVGR
jgi:flagellar hook-associated protein 1 FlgK